MKKSRLKKRNKKYRIIAKILIIISLIFAFSIIRSNVLPDKYLSKVLLILGAFNIINVLLLNIERLKTKIKGSISLLVLFACLFMTIASIYLNKTIFILQNNGDSKYKIENYYLLVLNNSKISSISELNDTKIGYYENSLGSNDALSKLYKKIDFTKKSYTSFDLMVEDLKDKKISGVLLESSIIEIIDEENGEFKSSTSIVDSIKIQTEVESTLKDVDVIKDPFSIYISGIDTYGEIASVSRSDVNIVATVNPKTKQILLISIPRDYYVKLHGINGANDKLTHAGIYGVDMSIKTIEDLLDTKINYYLKVNFTSVIDIVDAIDGVDVYSEYTFTSFSGYSFKEGLNKVNGEEALDFARTRKAFSNGDRQRGINQQALIEAIIRKATNKSIITKYNSLLDSIDGKYQTNMSYKKITSLIKMQLNDMSPWNITSYSLSGEDSYNYAYTANQQLYVMEPDLESINEAKDLIRQTLEDQKLENSYKDLSGQTHNVYKKN